jgi:hypothetical protein
MSVSVGVLSLLEENKVEESSDGKESKSVDG